MKEPSFVDRGGELVYAPPFLADNVQHYGFMLDADIDALHEICNRFFNDPLGECRFVPGGPFVMLACCGLPSLRSTTPPYSGMGWFAENEIAFWMLVIDKKDKRMYWNLPYIWVDNEYAFAMGRELYGFQKGIGTITLPDSPDDAELFALDTMVLKKYSPDTKGEIVRLVQAQKVTGSTPVPRTLKRTAWGIIKEFMKEVVTIADDDLSLLGNAKLIMDSMDDMIHRRVPMVFLKQFRDVGSPARASFQAIVETQAQMKKFHSAKILTDAYDIDIALCDSHPVRKDLGLASGKLRSKLSIWMNYDFEIGLGEQTIIK